MPIKIRASLYHPACILFLTSTADIVGEAAFVSSYVPPGFQKRYVDVLFFFCLFSCPFLSFFCRLLMLFSLVRMFLIGMRTTKKFSTLQLFNEMVVVFRFNLLGKIQVKIKITYISVESSWVSY